MKEDDLTREQKLAVQAWWEANDPDEYLFDFVDNERYAIQGNLDQEREYERCRANGCCGSMDVIIEVGDVKLMFGFNYGH